MELDRAHLDTCQQTIGYVDIEIEEGAHTCRAVIETPKGSRSRYTYEPEIEALVLSGLLPAGMSFPLDFGFVPSTLAEDGDPLDILVVGDDPSAPGCVVLVTLLGVIEAEQTEGGNTVRNDRLSARTSLSGGGQRGRSRRFVRQSPRPLLRHRQRTEEERLQGARRGRAGTSTEPAPGCDRISVSNRGRTRKIIARDVVRA
ncbi:inorganic diphosphatase [Sphingomonas sp. So64.6b]|nr:inorganic diphosphatase [Sphingomonas sp. So64.6b]